MRPTDRCLTALSRMPFVDSAELAGILGEPHATVHRALTGLLADGNAGRVSHGTAHLPSSQRYYLTTKGIGDTATGSSALRRPRTSCEPTRMSREWLALLTRRMDAVASRLPTRRLDCLPGPAPASVARGVPPQGPLRRHDHPPRWPRASAWCARA